MTKVASGITGMSLVCIPSTDQDKAIAFYEDVLGFEKRVDEPFGGQYRWVEVHPAVGTTGIALAPPPPGGATSTQTGIALTTDDIDATHAAMKAAGADVDEQVMRMEPPVPPMFWFRDPDGNTLMVVESPQD